MVKRPMKFAIREGIALQVNPSWQTVGNAGPTTGLITSTRRLDRIGYQIRDYKNCGINSKYDGQGKDYADDQYIIKEPKIKVAIEIVIGDKVFDRDQVGVTHDKRSRSKECVSYHVIRDHQGDGDQGGDRDRDW